MAAQASPQVLVVEDEPDLADLYRQWLTDDYEVLVANEGGAALSALDADPDVVLLDRRMPGLTGDEVLAEIRELGLDCRVAMVTAVTPEADVVELGIDDYLVKPVSAPDLRAVVERLHRRNAHARELQDFFALASKKAVLDHDADAATRSTEAYAELEAALEAQAQALDARLQELDRDDFEALFYDLREDSIPDPAG